MRRALCIVTASNDEECLHRNLLASDIVRRRGVPVHVERGAPSASIAYNRGLAATDAPIVIFAHQDVYFPPVFAAALDRVLDWLDAHDPDWAVLAPFGMSVDGRHLGNVWSTSQSGLVGTPVDMPTPVVSFDEMTIILRRDSNIAFDEGLPLYHLYGTDIVQAARAAGHGAYVADLPVVHNDSFHGRLGRDFTRGYDYVRRKWRKALPLRTPVLWVRWHGLDLPWYRLRARRSFAARQAKAGDETADPKIYACECGWEDLPPAPQSRQKRHSLKEDT
ncbi:hypothetical protein DKT77_03655 [Meridianimarinicoccus roseus]|uniref:Glycosyltransferase n=1 Tax=Meridianimarinicoccus roseus TaxID=2072018 RepID=A0A2V2LEU8_9RHOB|nr:hypothetical protein [Meridianimarinicoccus roseus]PWR03985.1 hypothetical protein DKT77_03655 [Meridianimarinicoccus roseus]